MKRESNYRFEAVVLRHLDIAHSLARWLIGNDADAEDVVQEAAVKAFKNIERQHFGYGRGWFLAIVRNASIDRLKQLKRTRELEAPLEAEIRDDRDADPEAILLRSFDAEMLWDAIDRLPVDYREIIVMRELQELSYMEISMVVSLPIGTVMSRLSRARRRLQIDLEGRV